MLIKKFTQFKQLTSNKTITKKTYKVYHESTKSKLLREKLNLIPNEGTCLVIIVNKKSNSFLN